MIDYNENDNNDEQKENIDKTYIDLDVDINTYTLNTRSALLRCCLISNT